MNVTSTTNALFTTEQQAWLDGFLAGIDAARGQQSNAPAPTLTVEVLFGTQTGNAGYLAEQLVGALHAAGLGANATELDAAGVERLLDSSHVVVISSTYGEGEMPDNAELFWEALVDSGTPRLEHLKYSVLALGDSGYDHFCQAGKDIDLRLEQLGARRLAARVDCDIEFEEPAEHWLDEVTALLVAEAPGGRAGGVGGSAGAAAQSGMSTRAAAPAKKRSPWNRRTPFGSRVAASRLLSKPGSAKQIYHYEFDLADSGIEYAAGDALAVMPVNDPLLVDAMIGQLGLSPESDIDGVALAERMRCEWEIRTPSKELISLLADRAPSSELADVVRRDDHDALDSWLWGRDVLDLLELTGVRFHEPELTGIFRSLQARQYSISSSPLASPDRVHLTIAAVRYGEPRVRGGVCSTFLAERLGENELVGIYPQPNQAFSVPSDLSRPIIMVGPGTGIAPFRGFLHERMESGATGGNWLFFGDQHRATDFIYEDELTSLSKKGVLTHLDLAFSRDQAEKIYVQNRMREKASELYAWLQEGAYFYVCGDASRMAKDVERALLQVIAEQSGTGDDGARDYLAQLKKEKRYVRDVY